MAGRLRSCLAAAAVLVAVSAPPAFANFGPHGGYPEDTDNCAGCHRAHTSFASATFTDGQGSQRYGLLVSGAASITQFCLACHGDGTPGASTNVESGIFDAGPSNDVAGMISGGGAYTPYQTESVYGAPLNGGQFGGTTSTHQMESQNLPMWGSYAANDSPAAWPLFTCIDCHDPHGSSNYRLLRDQVNGATVGGYIGDVPDPWVVSNETGYPPGGWEKGVQGAAQMAAYVPSFTTPKYGSAFSGNERRNRNVSGWCCACHTQYIVRDDVGDTDGIGAGWGPSSFGRTNTRVDNGAYEAWPYNQGGYTPSPPGGPFSSSDTAVGDQSRHRHPVNVALNGTGTGWSAAGLITRPALDASLPLESPVSLGVPSGATDKRGVAITWDENGYVGCLTCHFAHGTAQTMSGWANAELRPGPYGMIPVQIASAQTGVPGPTKTWPLGTGAAQVDRGVNPGFSSALLRRPNRGVCERCHNK